MELQSGSFFCLNFFVVNTIDQFSQRYYNDDIDWFGQFNNYNSFLRGGSTIYSKFLKLAEEKRDRILNAAMKEFAQQGYKNASTDNIVKEAAISKGALFHYFKNKKGLFLFLYDYSLEIVTNEILMKVDYEEKDAFKRRRQAVQQKLEVLRKHPLFYDFLTAAYFDEAIEIKSDIESKNNKLLVYGKAKLYEGIDTSMFKDDVDVNRAFEIIYWTDEGFSKKVTAQIKNMPIDQIDYDGMLEELDVYMNILKRCFYKD